MDLVPSISKETLLILIFFAGVMVFVLRSRLPFTRSRPSRAMLIVTGVVMLGTLLLPYSPLAHFLGFTPLPIGYLLVIFAIVIGYALSAEAAKRWFYQNSSE